MRPWNTRQERSSVLASRQSSLTSIRTSLHTGLVWTSRNRSSRLRMTLRCMTLHWNPQTMKHRVLTVTGFTSGLSLSHSITVTMRISLNSARLRMALSGNRLILTFTAPLMIILQNGHMTPTVISLCLILTSNPLHTNRKTG